MTYPGSVLTLQQYANVMGLTKELHLKGNDFTNASSAFWIAVLIAEFPSSKSGLEWSISQH
jgi:hypothetical protein